MSSRLRIGINLGNELLVKISENGALAGIVIDLAEEFAKRTGRPFDVVRYMSAGKMADGATSGAWDLAFLAVDPFRAETIDFTPPYLEVDTTYLVPAGSPLQRLDQVDADGVSIAVSEKSAYDLFLTRELKHATLMRAPTPPDSVDLFFQSKLDALAGLRPFLMRVSGMQEGSRVLDGRFTVVQQALGTPKGHVEMAKIAVEFVDDIKRSGLAARIVAKNGAQGVTVLS